MINIRAYYEHWADERPVGMTCYKMEEMIILN